MNYILIGTLIVLAIYMMSRTKGGNTSSSSSFQTISVAQAKEMIKSSKPTLLDVRTPMEVSGGKISKALTINVAGPSFVSEVNKLNKEDTYIVYCRSGRRSVNACNIMAKEGFTNLYNLQGGYSAWK